MSTIRNITLSISLSLLITACINQDPNINAEGKDELKSLEMEDSIRQKDINYQDIFYVPIYSDIYVDANHPNNLLAATLSIRNTSHKDSIYIYKINYFNTAGELVRSYIESPILLGPMATLNYVIEKEDDTGGNGANFIVELSAKKNIKPLIQAIMVGQYSNKGFAFSIDGYSIK